MMRPMVDTLITVYAKGNNMSRIKDLLAEEQNIDDLKQPLYQKLGEMIYVKAKNWDGIRSWFRSNAEYEAGKDDEGHTEWYFENFEDLCEQAVNDMLDKLIEEAQQELCATCPEADTCEDAVKPESKSAPEPETETDKAYTRLKEALDAYLKTLGN